MTVIEIKSMVMIFLLVLRTLCVSPENEFQDILTIISFCWLFNASPTTQGNWL